MNTRDYHQIPLQPSRYGQRMYQLGRRLVLDHGLHPERLVWDADEVLWDWVIDASVLASDGYRYFLFGDVAHQEHLRVKPGMLELIWGIHHASFELAIDPYLRIWTNGYPWRMWKISQEIPGFAELMGPPADPDCVDGWAEHPRLFTRLDYALAAAPLIDRVRREQVMLTLPPGSAAVLREHWRVKPWDSNLKLPELAKLAGKTGFSASGILIDDRRRNVERFVHSGRQGVVISHPRDFGGLLHLNFSRDPRRYLQRGTTHIAEHLADALRRLATEPALLVCAMSLEPVLDYPLIDFTLTIPNEILQREWVQPRRGLKREMNRRR